MSVLFFHLIFRFFSFGYASDLVGFWFEVMIERDLGFIMTDFVLISVEN